MVPVAGLLVGGFLLIFEPVEVEAPTGPRAAARANPRLAAERFLAAMGTEVGARSVLALPDEATPLLLFTPPGTLAGSEAAVLAEWVERGGRLVTTPQPALADLLDLPVVASAAGVPGETAIVAPPPRIAGQGAPPPAPGGSYRVWMPAGPRLADTAEGGTALAAGVAFTRKVGEGQVVLLASDAFLHNDRLGELDHAGFLWALVAGENGGAPSAVRLVARDEPPTLRDLLVARGWPLLLMAGLLIAAWAARVGVRTGPVLAADLPPRRSLLEHVRASGELLWRLGEREALVSGLRQAVWRRAGQRHPAWAGLPPRQRVQRLAAAAGVSGGLLAQALEGPEPADAPAFLRAVQLLHRVWRSL